MTTLTINTEDKEVLKAVKALLKGFKVSFEEKPDKPYDPEFVALVKEAEKEIKEGKGIKMSSTELKALWK